MTDVKLFPGAITVEPVQKEEVKAEPVKVAKPKLKRENLPQPTGQHTIKRYPNRKLYSLPKRDYLNLSEVMALYRSGENIVILDQTGQDITFMSLLTAFLQESDSLTFEVKAAMLEIVKKGNS